MCSAEAKNGSQCLQHLAAVSQFCTASLAAGQNLECQQWPRAKQRSGSLAGPRREIGAKQLGKMPRGRSGGCSLNSDLATRRGFEEHESCKRVCWWQRRRVAGASQGGIVSQALCLDSMIQWIGRVEHSLPALVLRSRWYEAHQGTMRGRH